MQCNPPLLVLIGLVASALDSMNKLTCTSVDDVSVVAKQNWHSSGITWRVDGQVQRRLTRLERLQDMFRKHKLIIIIIIFTIFSLLWQL